MTSGRDERKTFSIVTFGCKLNQFESECVRQSLVRGNWEYRRFEEGARFYIINSCTVTGKSDSRCRNAIRRANRISPGSTIIVTGCYAEIQPEKLADMPEVTLVLGNEEKSRIPRILNRMADDRGIIPTGLTRSRFDEESDEPTEISDFLDHARAFIKIQEGCNASCSYCIIPQARGRSRSTPVADVLKQIDTLQQNGYEEVVLTGIHIGRYGLDLVPRTSLTELIEVILAKTNVARIRLSSIEVTEVTPGLVDLVARNNRVAAHLHIPLQSGDNEILAAMNRPYHADFFREKIMEISSFGPGIAVGTDIIVGFPGEGAEHFSNTYRLVRDLPISYFHVFSFSRRPGTKASAMPGQIPPEVKKKRSKKLIQLGKMKKRQFMKSRVGSKELALVQGPKHRYSRFSRTMTGNYCEVYVQCPSSMTGKLTPLIVTHYSRGRLYGHIMERSATSGA